MQNRCKWLRLLQNALALSLVTIKLCQCQSV